MKSTSSLAQLIFRKLESTASLKDVARILYNEQKLPKAKVLYMMRNNEPGLILPSAPLETTERLRLRLLAHGCLAETLALDEHDECPFPVTRLQSHQISRELCKADRGKTPLLMVLAQIHPLNGNGSLPPVLGRVQKALETGLRLSDTVLGIDDTRLLVLGFATRADLANVLYAKIEQHLVRIYRNKIDVSLGAVELPHEGRDVGALLHLADKRRENADFPCGGRTRRAIGPTIKRSPGAGELDQGYLPLVFRRAHGRQFQKLLSLDTETLYAGLHLLTPAEQDDFVTRLDCYTPLPEDLLARLEAKELPERDARAAVANIFFPAIFHKELERREEIKNQVVEKLTQTQSLPTLPSTAMQVFELSSSPDADIRDLVKVLSHDPAMSSKLLQVANSPFYGFASQVLDIRRAVALLGFTTVMDLALGISAANVLKNSAISKVYNPEVIWRHSYVTGLLAGKLAQNASSQLRSQIFTIALLHDIGKIFFATHFTEMYKNIVANSARFSIPVYELEMEVFGMCHAQVGKIISQNWHFPEKVVEGIAFHHMPHKESNNTGIPALIGFADYLYNLASSEMEHDEPYPEPNPILTYGHWKMLQYYSSGLSTANIAKLKEYAIKLIEDNADMKQLY